MVIATIFSLLLLRTIHTTPDHSLRNPGTNDPLGLKQDLHVGDEIEVVLHFRDHEDMTIKVPVQEAMEHEHEH